jgi:hypothetical protein
MKVATLAMTLSSELLYTCLMIVTWVVLFGWATALIGACTLVFRNRDRDENAPGTVVPASTRREHSSTAMGFGL